MPIDPQDIFGNVLRVGDVVATQVPEHRHRLVRGTVVLILTKRLRVRVEGESIPRLVAAKQVSKRGGF